jgi:hypothetical protein
VDVDWRVIAAWRVVAINVKQGATATLCTVHLHANNLAVAFIATVDTPAKSQRVVKIVAAV